MSSHLQSALHSRRQHGVKWHTQEFVGECRVGSASGRLDNELFLSRSFLARLATNGNLFLFLVLCFSACLCVYLYWAFRVLRMQLFFIGPYYSLLEVGYICGLRNHHSNVRWYEVKSLSHPQSHGILNQYLSSNAIKRWKLGHPFTVNFELRRFNINKTFFSFASPY